jgi:hypothetical protein
MHMLFVVNVSLTGSFMRATRSFSSLAIKYPRSYVVQESLKKMISEIEILPLQSRSPLNAVGGSWKFACMLQE